MKPLFPTYIIKQHAKQGMRKSFFKALAVTMLPAFVVSIVAITVMCFTPGFENTLKLLATADIEALDTVFYNFTLAVSALMVVFAFLNVGSMKVTLDMIRGKDVKIRDVFKLYDKWYVAAIYPFITFIYTYGVNELAKMAQASGADAMAMTVVVGVFDIIFYVISFKLIFVEYALADNDCKSFKDAVVKAWRMTGITTIANNLVLMFSFMLWYLLVMFTGGIAMFYVYPYLMFSVAALYDLNCRFAKHGASAFTKQTPPTDETTQDADEDEYEYIDEE